MHREQSHAHVTALIKLEGKTILIANNDKAFSGGSMGGPASRTRIYRWLKSVSRKARTPLLAMVTNQITPAAEG